MSTIWCLSWSTLCYGHEWIIKSVLKRLYILYMSVIICTDTHTTLLSLVRRLCKKMHRRNPQSVAVFIVHSSMLML